MKLGITGLPGSGKTTIFEALTQIFSDSGNKSENRVNTTSVPDSRIDVLSGMYNPQKTIFAQVQYFLPGMLAHHKEKSDDNLWTQVRDCDALIHVVRNFRGPGLEEPRPHQDFSRLDQELIFADLVVAEKRIERMESEKKRGRKINDEEFSLLSKCLKNFENEKPLRKVPELATAQLLKGFAFLSARPEIALFNNEDDDQEIPEPRDTGTKENCMVMRGKLEHEIARMSAEEADEFLKEFNIKDSAKNRVIKQSYDLLGLISFFTVGEDEVRAWTIKKGTSALDAAGAIHTDFKKGFIRAEVVSYEDLIDAKTYPEARKRGKVRLEGKTYPVQDGDIINFRFNV